MENALPAVQPIVQSVQDTILFKVLTFIPNVAAALTVSSLKFIWNYKTSLSIVTLISGSSIYVFKKVSDKVNEYILYFTFDKNEQPALYAKFESAFSDI